MGLLRLWNAVIGRLRGLLRHARFRIWTARLSRALRRQGAKLIVDVASPPELEGLPELRIIGAGEGDATLTLRIGQGVLLGRHVELEVWAGGTNVLELEDHVHVLAFTRLKLRSGRIRLGSNSHIREFCMLKSGGDLDIGRDVEVSYGTTMHCHERIELEDWVGITDRVTIVDSEHTLDGTGDEHFYHRPVRADPVTVGRNTFLASNSVIAAGSHIGPNAAVAAGAVLTGGDYPGGWLIAGVPARPYKQLSASEDRETAASMAGQRPG
jgi:acetyltransferase-like isoleucine patch superfamily enzyme